MLCVIISGLEFSQIFIIPYMFCRVIFESYPGQFDYYVMTLWFYEYPEENGHFPFFSLLISHQN